MINIGDEVRIVGTPEEFKKIALQGFQGREGIYLDKRRHQAGVDAEVVYVKIEEHEYFILPHMMELIIRKPFEGDIEFDICI